MKKICLILLASILSFSVSAEKSKRVFVERMWLSGSSTTDMAIDGTTPKTFIVSPMAGKVLHITRVIFYVQDSGSFDATSWGNGITMSNGMDFKYKQDSVVRDLVTFPIKTSGDLASLCFDVDVKTWGVGDEFLVARFTITKTGTDIVLRKPTDELQIIINDNLTALTAQYIIAEGYYEDSDLIY